MTPKATAIILARAGSKGLPGKNHAIVGGKPCIQWTIDAAKAATTINQIIVSTDDPEIITIANAADCTVVERPIELAHATATIASAARHAYESTDSPDTPIVILYANVPVRPDGLIDQAVNLLVKTHCHSVQSYTNVGKHHPWWTVKIDNDGTIHPWQGDTLYHNTFRRQDLPPAQIPDGGVIALTPDALMQRLNAPEGPHSFLGTDRRGIMTNEGEVIDIDTHIDQLVADAILKERTKERLTTEGTEITEKIQTGVEKERDGEYADLTHKIIGCAMRVHQELGPGLLESVYEVCLLDELRNSGIQATNQVCMDVKYKDRIVRSGLRLDLLIEDRIVLEIKAVETLKKVHQAQLLTYMKLSNCKIGLLMNFNQSTLKSGLKRMVL